MSPPKSTQELADHVEALVAAYLSEGRRAVQQAIDRAFPTTATATRKSTSANVKPTKRASGKRRGLEELAELSEQLYELVRARPGESMAVFSAELGVAVGALHRPMTWLKRDGRVRSVGERQHTRYFPTPAGKARAGA